MSDHIMLALPTGVIVYCFLYSAWHDLQLPFSPSVLEGERLKLDMGCWSPHLVQVLSLVGMLICSRWVSDLLPVLLGGG